MPLSTSGQLIVERAAAHASEGMSFNSNLVALKSSVNSIPNPTARCDPLRESAGALWNYRTEQHRIMYLCELSLTPVARYGALLRLSIVLSINPLSFFTGGAFFSWAVRAMLAVRERIKVKCLARFHSFYASQDKHFFYRHGYR